MTTNSLLSKENNFSEFRHIKWKKSVVVEFWVFKNLHNTSSVKLFAMHH